VIFYFSGTGNSLYVARQLAEHLPDTQVMPMTGEAPAEKIGGEAEPVGFVFPSFYGNLPRLVREFITRLSFKENTYVYTVVTMGGFGQGSIGALQGLLNAQGVELSYGKGLRMGANYILKYDPRRMAKLAASPQRTDRKISKIAAALQSRRLLIQTSRISADTLYTDVEKLDDDFYADETCTACGICAKVCPVQNITLSSGRPEWLHRCEHCVACISWCPEQAIQYGDKTRSRTRYHNSHISLSDMLQLPRDSLD
jgi:ferredoxin